MSDPQYLPDPRALELGPSFSDEVEPARFPDHVLRFRNDRWAYRVGLEALPASAWEAHFARFQPLPGNLEQPLALRYHGHQFGVYNPSLGDGRGFLFAQLREDGDPRGRLLDLGTKGSGPTPWSRGGDGKLTLQGGVREILATEMLEALDVPTSKTFSLFETGERLMRGDEPSPTRSCVLVRLSHSHLRFGTFQRFAHTRDAASLERLVSHVIDVHAPELSSDADPPLALFRRIVDKTARLAAAFQAAGFVHGVLNTDNMNVNGEAFDFGPWRFLIEWEPEHIAAYFDHAGRYAFGNQPATFRWNLGRLADAMRSLSPSATWGAALDSFDRVYEEELGRRFAQRLGVRSRGPELDGVLVAAVIDRLESSRTPLVDFFDAWWGGTAALDRARPSRYADLVEARASAALRHVLEAYEPTCSAGARAFGSEEPPVNLHIATVRGIWSAIADRDDWDPLHRTIERIRALGAHCR